MPESTLVTPEEAAARLRVSEETVRRWCREKMIRCVKLGRQYRIPSEVVRDLEVNGLAFDDVSEEESDDQAPPRSSGVSGGPIGGGGSGPGPEALRFRAASDLLTPIIIE